MTLPNYFFEKKLFKKGHRYVAGVDEVGRGCFAGSVVAACVILKIGALPLDRSIVVNDSKRLTPRARERASYWIKRNALCYGIGWATVAQINKLGIKKATEIAFRKAIARCKLKIDYLLIDAFYIPYVKGLRRKNQKAIVRGDTKSISIAAASVIAKVYRDDLMRKLGNEPKYRKYGWGRNKGYGTLRHRKAIKKYGLTRLHRKQFVATWLKNSSSSPVQ